MKINAVKTVIIWIVLACFVVSCFVSTVNAQLPPYIQGHVYLNGVPTDGIAITASPSGNSTTTSSGGLYTLDSILDETGTVTANYNGFTATQNYDLSSGSSTTVDLYIQTPATINGNIFYMGSPAGAGSFTIVALDGSTSVGSVSYPSGGGYSVTGLPNSKLIEIQATYTASTGTVTGSATYTTSSTGGDVGTVDIHLTPPAISASGTVTYNNGTISGSGLTVIATSGGIDYQASVTDGTFTISNLPGDSDITFTATYNGNSALPITVHSKADRSALSVPININSPPPTVAGEGSFHFQTADANAASGDVVVNVLRTGSSSGTSSVELWISGSSTAVSGEDFNVKPYAPITLTFGPGETMKSVTVSILGSHPGVASKTILLMLVNPSSGASIGSPDTYALALGDRPAATPTHLPAATPLSSSTPTAKPTQGAVTTSPAPSRQPQGTATPAPKPTTNATKPDWSWAALLAFVPLTGIVIYYLAFLKDR